LVLKFFGVKELAFEDDMTQASPHLRKFKLANGNIDPMAIGDKSATQFYVWSLVEVR
jgi:hypothetical protein